MRIVISLEKKLQLLNSRHLLYCRIEMSFRVLTNLKTLVHSQNIWRTVGYRVGNIVLVLGLMLSEYPFDCIPP